MGKNAEHISSKQLTKIFEATIQGLLGTYQLHQNLGKNGKTELKINQFGETTLVLDYEAEETIIKALTKLDIPMQFFSEEHESIHVENPRATVIIDGLDGSAEYKNKMGKSMYGTMIAVLEGDDPTYDNYIVCGIMIHSPQPKLYIALRDQGCFLIDSMKGTREKLTIKQTDTLSFKSIIDLDINWDQLKNVFENVENRIKFPLMQCLYKSQAARSVLFITGDIDFQLEVTRKGSMQQNRIGNLEMPCTYGLIRELGGVMTLADGNSMGPKKFFTFGQGPNLAIIVAPGKASAKRISMALSLK